MPANKKKYVIEIEYSSPGSAYKPVCIEVRHGTVTRDFSGEMLKPLLAQVARYILEAES